MTRTLQLTFLTSADKKVTVTIDEPRFNLSNEAVAQAMDLIIQKDIFKVEDHSFVLPVSAKIVERSVTDFHVN